MPGSALRAHAGTSTRDPSSSTTQTRQRSPASAFRDSRASACRSPSGLHASRIVAAFGTVAGLAVDRRSRSSLRLRLAGRRSTCDSAALRRFDRAVRPSARARRSMRRASRARSRRAAQRRTLARRSQRAAPAPPPAARCRRGTARTGRTISSRKKRAMRSSDREHIDRVVEQHHDARAERRAGGARVFEASAASRAPPARRTSRPRRRAESACSVVPPGTPPASSISVAERRAVRNFVDARAARSRPKGRTAACRSTFGVRCAHTRRRPRADRAEDSRAFRRC